MTPAVFYPTAQLSFKTVEQNNKALHLFCRKRQGRQLVCDLKQVTFCDSAGLAFLIQVKILAQQYQQQVSFKHMNHSISALADFYDLNDLLNPLI
ncbi:MAG: hypothetical protein CMF38_06490 [Legionellaceae bacterium]|nr:hypothetical protein [Legionellaceae bacterium]HAF87853.1 hypothetical protein [Legionellales bacterium]HCA89181.1 hypothetical protein [Legionellales bacterium]|tara:strand:- start:617 stop:901 length:285 start_codon:yes stop_codon:yes gene_type:complete